MGHLTLWCGACSAPRLPGDTQFYKPSYQVGYQPSGQRVGDATGRLGASETTARATATTAGWSAVWTVTMLIICTVVCALTLLAILADADHSRPGRYNADVEAVRTVLTCKRQGAREATRQVTSTTHSKNDRLGRTGSDSRYGEAGVCLLAARYADGVGARGTECTNAGGRPGVYERHNGTRDTPGVGGWG